MEDAYAFYPSPGLDMVQGWPQQMQPAPQQTVSPMHASGDDIPWQHGNPPISGLEWLQFPNCNIQPDFNGSLQYEIASQQEVNDLALGTIGYDGQLENFSAPTSNEDASFTLLSAEEIEASNKPFLNLTDPTVIADSQ